MTITEENCKDNLDMFHSLLNSTGVYYFWEYDSNMALIHTSSPQLDFDELLEYSDAKSFLCNNPKKHQPVVLCSNLGLVWIADYQYDAYCENPMKIHVIGPINDAESALGDREALSRQLKLPGRWRQELECLAKELPIISTISLIPYAQMLHKCVTGENIPRRDVLFQSNLTMANNEQAISRRKDRYGSYSLEQAVLCNIRKGNLNYQNDWDRMTRQASGVRVTNQTMLERGRVSVITFIATCSRAAIEGGLTPEMAFTVGDSYLEQALACTTLGDLKNLNSTMYDDFVRRVHVLQANPSYSRQVQFCCDYIENNIHQNISAAELAANLGYNEYYLTRKFTEETGVSINSYAKAIKIERAKQLLSYTDMSIEDIREELGFCTRSYFAKVFHDFAGVSPAKYRASHYK